jgi:methylmalonyl-CoA mutase C-terminal domain/subunit
LNAGARTRARTKFALREADGSPVRPIRVLVAKAGLDSHDRGAKVIARALRDAGMEVIYTGLHRTPEHVVQAAVQEDVDVVAISLLSGAHLTVVPKIIEGLRAQDAGDMLVLLGGIVPDEDVGPLREAGVSAVFGPGTDTAEVVDFIQGNVRMGSPA